MTSWDRLVAAGKLQAQVALAPLTTYKLGGPASYLAEAGGVELLAELAAAYSDHPLPVLVVGRGSNLVVADSGFPGLVIRLGGALARIEVDGEVVAGGGAGLPQLARAAVKGGRLGLEFMVGIPGSVGGAVRQNAGCFGCEMVDVLSWVDVFDLASGHLRRWPGGELGLSYRRSRIGPTEVVTAAGLVTIPGEPAVGEAKMREITRWRRTHQPGGTLNAGSVFKNPPGDAAGRIIDDLGLKGLRVGGASVSDKHANFFVANPGTTASDVYRLVRLVAHRVREATGIELEPEILFAGDFEEAGHG
jgi:UDP-N-acetylmuramate dehydrogenase